MKGWKLVAWAALIETLLVGPALFWVGFQEDGWRLAIRWTARFSAALFLSAFLASSLRYVWKNRFTAWLLGNRRYIGVSFAASQGLHLIAIVGTAVVAPNFIKSLEPLALVGGSLGYLFVIALTLTSFDRSTRALGPKWWHRLHSTGMYYLWLVFAFTYVGSASHSRLHFGLAIFFLAALLFKLGVKWKKRSAYVGYSSGSASVLSDAEKP